MFPQCSHITRKRGIFTYRRRLPRPLTGEVTLSLNTTSFWTARAIGEALDHAFDRFFKMQSSSTFDIKAALRNYLRNELRQLREKHLATPPERPVHATEVHYPYDRHAAREADYNAIKWKVRRLKRNLREREVREYDLIVDDLTCGHTLSSHERTEFAFGLIQADIQVLHQSEQWLRHGLVKPINRVRCRRVIDSEGNCPTTDVFVVLPRGADGDAILSHLEEEMPEVGIAPWEFEMDGPSERVRRGSSHEALLALMANRQPGETPMSLIKCELGLTDSATKDLRGVLRDDSHDLTKSLAHIGVRYVTTGKGRGARSYLLKR